MRPIKRIDNFINKVDWRDLINKRWKLQLSINNNVFDLLYNNKWDINYWKKNPDQRIGQVLINLGLIKDLPQIWNDEEEDILISQGVPLEQCLFWRIKYDKNENLLETSIVKLVNDLSKDHIHNIIRYFEKHNIVIPNKYFRAFINVLNK